MTALYNISPIDGRYNSKTRVLVDYFSEYALIKTRVEVEVEYLLALSLQGIKGLQLFNENEKTLLRNIYKNFSIQDAEKVKEIETIQNHDVKAIEYFIKDKCSELKIEFNTEFIHFGLTSQDINNTSFPLMLKRYLTNEFIPKNQNFISELKEKAQAWKQITLLAKTHGQPASPTTLGKEIQVFADRIQHQLDILNSAKHYGKFGGATGNFNAHKLAYVSINWKEFGFNFLNELGLERLEHTTQIEHYDGMAHILDTCKRIHTIYIDFARDIWSYISFDIFTQKIITTETGSSAMPHKVNPIDFENAEGNLLIANASFEFLSSKLPISRLQRDLTDSTVLRNIGVPFAHFEIAISSLIKGMGKLIVNEIKINEELENNWIVIAEGIQTILRREGIEKPYELLKDFSRQKEKPNKERFHRFIDGLSISEEVKLELKAISPYNYIGYTL